MHEHEWENGVCGSCGLVASEAYEELLDNHWELLDEHERLHGSVREVRAFLTLLVEGTEFYNPPTKRAAQRVLIDLGGPPKNEVGTP